MSNAGGIICCKHLNPSSTCCNLSGWLLVEYIVFCHVIWWLSYWFLLLMTRQSEEWCCRVLTFFHGCIVSSLAICDIFLNKTGFGCQSPPLTESQKNYLSFMLSYFLFDFLWIHLFGNEAWIIYFHHLSSIFILMKIMASDFGGIIVSYGVAGLEFTNPYLQLRWFLRTHGHLNTPIHTAVEIWFFICFFVIRIFGGTFIFYYTEFKSDADIMMKLSCLSIYIVSLILTWQILNYLKKKYWNQQNGRNMYIINSRVSISPYFQRRTLDRVQGDDNELNSGDSRNETPSRPPDKVSSPPDDSVENPQEANDE